MALTSGGQGLGDDPVYINKFLDWMKAPANDVVYESYFDFDVPGQVDAITDGRFPESLQAFTTDLGHPGHRNGQATWPAWATVAGVLVVAGGLGILRISRRARRRAKRSTQV